jgi:predicted TIM-barrel enzyme
LHEAKEAVPEMPVLANTGVREETVDAILAIADGLLVGTSLKRDGVTWNPVDPDRAGRFMTAVHRAREAVPA